MITLKEQVETCLEELASWENGLAELESELEKAKGEESAALGYMSLDPDPDPRRFLDLRRSLENAQRAAYARNFIGGPSRRGIGRKSGSAA
jgi:hypothetical protein